MSLGPKFVDSKGKSSTVEKLEKVEDEEDNVYVDEEDAEEQEEAVEEEEYEEEEEQEEEEEKPKSRQQKRKQEREVKKNGKHRPPQSSVAVEPIERYSELNNPSDKFVGRGEEPSRMQEVAATGELIPYNRKQILKEYSRMQAFRNAFVAWQAQQDDYVIYQYVGYDKNTGADRWTAAHYEFNPLTMGQHLKLQALESKLNDLKRAAQNNDVSIKDVYRQIRETDLNVWKLKCELYFRMDVQTEFEKSSYSDVRDMIEAWEWANQWVPKSRRIKPSDGFGSNLSRKAMSRHGPLEEDMVQ